MRSWYFNFYHYTELYSHISDSYDRYSTNLYINNNQNKKVDRNYFPLFSLPFCVLQKSLDVYFNFLTFIFLSEDKCCMKSDNVENLVVNLREKTKWYQAVSLCLFWGEGFLCLPVVSWSSELDDYID